MSGGAGREGGAGSHQRPATGRSTMFTRQQTTAAPTGACAERPVHRGAGLRAVACLLATLGATLPCAAATYIVDRAHPDASDSHPGTASQPWKTIVHAARIATAGDTVLIKRGIYEDGDVVIANSGAPGHVLEFRAHPGDERLAVIRGAGLRSIGHSYITVRNLKVQEAPADGILFQGPANAAAPPASNIVIAGNHTFDTCSSGIALWGVPWLTDPGDYDNIRDVIIEDNLVELGTNGCYDEIITVANGAVNITVRNNEIRLGDPSMEGGDEGIDFKEGVRDSFIYGNYIHDLSDKAIYIDGGSDPRDPQITNIHIFNNVMARLPSAGISIVTEGRGDVDGIYVYNNVVYDVTGDGFLVYDHPGGNAEGGTVRNVHFINNTAYNAGTNVGGGFRVNHATATGIIFRNNIAWGNNDYDIRGESGTVVDNNLCAEAFCQIRSDPQFENVASRNLRLRATSPALDAGSTVLAPALDILGVARPQGAGIDLGAYEREVPDTTAPGPPTNVSVE
jgi:hypothetical protein